MLAEERVIMERVESAISPLSAPSHKSEEHHQAKEKSVYKGVFKCGKKYKAQIQTNRVQHYLGLFDTEIEAARAYDNHARVVLGPKARTNFEYPTTTTSEPTVLVAPLFVRQDGRTSSMMDGSSDQATSAAPKRSYVGIKMKRREVSEKKARLEDMEGHAYMPQYGSHAGPFAHMGGLSSLDSHHNTFMETSSFNPKTLGNMSEEQYRWYEQFQQMQQIQQHQQFLMQFGASLPSQFNPFAANFMAANMNNNSDHYAPPYGGSQMPLPMGNAGLPPSQYGSFPYEAFMSQAQTGHPYPGVKTAAAQFAHLASRTPELPQPASAFAGRGVTPPAPLKVPSYAFPSVPASAVGGTSAAANSTQNRPRARDMPRDQSTLAAAAQLGQLMALPTQPLLDTSDAVTRPAEKEKTPGENGVSEMVHKTVSPLSSSNTSRRGSLTTDDGTKVVFEPLSSKPGAYQFANQPLPLPKPSQTVVSTTTTVPTAEETTLEDEEEEEEELDWRDQLYYWTGILYFDPARGVQVWKGSWVGSYSGKPMSEEFSWSFNHFEYTLDGGRATPMMGPENTLLPQSGPMQGYYLMDNDGSGALQKYVDTEYTVEFEQLPNLVGGGVSELFAVYGRGDSDFGEFVVTGNYNKRTRILEMTRQYIAETDARSKMPLAQLKTLMRHQR